MAWAPGRVVFRGEIGPDSPLWTEDGVCLDLSLFQLPADLKERLLGVQEAWDLDDGQHEDWLARGRCLCEDR